MGRMIILLALLLSLDASAVTKVKALKVGTNGVPTETNQTTDYIAAPGMAFNNSDSTVIGVSSGFINLTHNGVTAPACFQSSNQFTTGSVLFSDSSGRLTENNSKFFWDNSVQGLSIGNNVATQSISGSSTNTYLTVETSGASQQLDLFVHRHNSSSSNGPVLAMGRTRNTSSSPTAVTNGDHLGELPFYGYSGASFRLGAQIYGEVSGTGTVGTGSMPGLLRFSVTPDGSTTPGDVLIMDQDKSSTFKGNIQMSSNTIYGDTASAGLLTLKSTTNATKGHISLNDKTTLFVDHPSTVSASENDIKFEPTNTMSVSGNGTLINNIYDHPTYTIAGSGSDVMTLDSIHLSPQITFNSGLAFLHYGLLYDGTFTVTANPGFGNTFALFYAQNTLQSQTVSVPPPGGSLFAGQVTVKGFGGVNVGTSGGFTEYFANPTYLASGAGSTMSVTNDIGFNHSPSYSADNATSSLTVANRIGFLAKDISTTTTGSLTISSDIGFQFDNQVNGAANSISVKALNLSQNSGSGFYNIYEGGTAQNVIKGNTTLGSTTAGSEVLNITGNALLGVASSTTGILKMANASSSHITAFQAGNATADKTYTLPLTDGTNGQVLTTDGSATLSWATAGTTNSPFVFCFGDTTTAGTSTATVPGANGTVSGFVVDVASHIKSFTCGVSAARTAGTATFKFLINGTADSTNTCVLDGTNTTTNKRTGISVALAAGDQVGVQVVTSSWTPTAADNGECVYITHD